MKKLLCLLLCGVMLAGCGGQEVPETVPETVTDAETVSQEVALTEFSGRMEGAAAQKEFVSRYSEETLIRLSDEGITVDGGEETEAVFTSRDIIYYEDKTVYESGYPYGEGTEADRHTAEEAQAHTVVNITEAGAYRITGKLSAGQIRVDLGADAYEDPDAVVELILADADITCTVAPAVLFLNVYECDGSWSVETAKPEVDTAAAGANLVLQGENTVSGSYVAKIYKDKEGEKKLWKQDGAIYSYMSMNVFGPGSLKLTAANEGLDTELHLTVNGGDITIYSGNDGINTNEDGVSVTTVNGGKLHIVAGLGEEGDGIDSNGYLVINGGTVIAAANPAADAGLDSDLGSYIHGGTVVALGSSMDWAESDSGQVTMNLQFGQYQDGDSALLVCQQDGSVVFAYDPGEDEKMAGNSRRYMGAILSGGCLEQGAQYCLYAGGSVSGEETDGVYTSVSGYEGGTRMAYSGTDVRMSPGGMGGFGDGWKPDGEMPEMPEGGFNGEMPEDMEIPEGGFRGEKPEGGADGEMPEMPEGGFDGEMPEDMEIPEGGFRGEKPEGGADGEMPGNGGGGRQELPQSFGGEANTLFYMQDMVNFFSGIAQVQE